MVFFIVAEKYLRTICEAGLDRKIAFRGRPASYDGLRGSEDQDRELVYWVGRWMTLELPADLPLGISGWKGASSRSAPLSQAPFGWPQKGSIV